MDDHKISVTLTGAAKIDGVREPAGKTVAVSMTVARQLAASGCIAPETVGGSTAAFNLADTPLESDFQEAVDQAVAQKAQLLAETMVHAAISAVVEPLERERDDLKKKLQFEADGVAALTQLLAEANLCAETAEKKLAEAEATLAKKAAPDADTKPPKPAKEEK